MLVPCAPGVTSPTWCLLEGSGLFLPFYYPFLSCFRFMESELDLNDIIQEMHVIATMPGLYHLLVELNAVQSLLGLLGHDNTDILHLLKQLSWERLSTDFSVIPHILLSQTPVDVFLAFPPHKIYVLVFGFFSLVKALFVQVILILIFFQCCYSSFLFYDPFI